MSYSTAPNSNEYLCNRIINRQNSQFKLLATGMAVSIPYPDVLPPKIINSGNGIAYLDGDLRLITYSVNAVLAYLPENIRPRYDVVKSCVVLNGGSTYEIGFVNIGVNGEITTESTVLDNSTYTLNDIHFFYDV